MDYIRHEKKFLCTRSMMTVLADRISKIMHPDPYAGDDGTYIVNSLYFDSPNSLSAMENEAGYERRTKYRIRYYNSGESLRLEKKSKLNNLSKKQTTPITKEQFEQFFSGNVHKILQTTQDELIKEFCVRILRDAFCPVVIVQYRRRPYIHTVGGCRITIDSDICFSPVLDKFLSGNFLKIPLNADNPGLLEIKYNNILPGYIRQTVYMRDLNTTTFSKYYLSRIASVKYGGKH